MLTLASAAAIAAPSYLDPSFGQSGRVNVQVVATCYGLKCSSSADALALAPDGRILVGGYNRYLAVAPGTDTPPGALLALSASGAPNPLFGGSSIAYAPFRVATVYALARGGLLLLGATDTGRVGVERYSASGALDSSFAAHGLLWLNSPANPVDELMDSAGRLVVLAGGASGRAVIVARFLATGRRDRHFGRDGIARLGKLSGQPAALATQRNGAVLIAGSTLRRRLFLVGLTSTGRLDGGFARDGVTYPPLASPVSPVLAIGPHGSVVLAAGTTLKGPPRVEELVVARYTRRGQLDRRFGRRGIAAVPLPTDRYAIGVRPHAIAFDAAGDPVVAGEQYGLSVDTPAGQGFLARFTPAGADCSFGSGGVLIAPGAGGFNAVAVQGDGRIVVAGWGPGTGFSAARYMGGGTPLTCS